ncbi:MAG: hypothetical protein K6E20_00040 [Acholeplasmatales bacterium]|nr:hypothetical protein [Acholeplasmatales bacterium]
MFNSIDEVYGYLYNQKKLKKREDLNRIKYCIDKLDLWPKYKIIHIAGTNGKGSTAAYIKSILSNCGMHVGFFISPFVISFNERIEINERMISNSEIMHYSNILYEFNENYKKEYDDVIPFFELTLLMALMFFKDRNIDIAVIECGLGGLLDATNILPKNISIITNIGFDHMAQLGNTLEEISFHKLGITRPNITNLTTVDKSLHNYFNNYAKEHNLNIKYLNDDVSDIKVSDFTYFKYKGIDYKSNLLGSYQAYNAALAIEAVKEILPNIEYDIIDYGLSHVFWPGRFEILNNNPKIILDGAHNIHAINALKNNIKNYIGNSKLKIMFTALFDKDYKSVIKSLDDVASFYYFTTINDLRATNSNDFKTCTNKDNIIIEDYKLCLDEAIKNLNENEVLLITGSLHFISTIREYYFTKYKN